MFVRELRARMVTPGARRVGADLLRQENRGSFAFVGDFFSWLGLLRRLQLLIDQADLRYRANDVFLLTIGIFLLAWLAVGLFGLNQWAVRIAVGAAFAMLPTLWIMRKRSVRLKKIEEQLPDAIDLFNRSMKAGHNIQSGLETIAGESPDPVRMEFKKVIEEMALGAPTEQALHHLGDRVPLIDLKFFVTGLILQRQTGANMVAMLENLALLIRERLNLAAKLKAGTAQQRMSAGLLCSLPIVMGLGFWILKPEYIDLLINDETGNIILTYAVVSEIIGILVIRKVASPKY